MEKKEKIGYIILFLVIAVLAIISEVWLLLMLQKYPEGLPWL